MKNQDFITAMKFNGFTEYEARIYVTLLKQHPLNGNSIAIASGVPGPKVYENLNKMKSNGIVFEVSEGSKSNKKRYSPLPYQDFLSSLNKNFLENTELLSEYFQKVSEEGDNDWTELFHIQGFEPAIEAVKSLIKGADKEITLSCWSSELDLLHTELLDAYGRGVSIISIIFDETHLSLPWKDFKHYKSETAEGRHSGELSCVIDLKKVIILESDAQKSYGIVSSHQAMVKTTRNYIRHDIYVNRLLHDFSKQIESQYGKELQGLIGDF